MSYIELFILITTFTLFVSSFTIAPDIALRFMMKDQPNTVNKRMELRSKIKRNMYITLAIYITVLSITINLLKHG